MSGGRKLDGVVRADAVVVGGGAAGMAATLGLEGLDVRLLARGTVGADGASAMAQGGIAAAVGTNDEPSLHAADTVEVAGGLAREEVVETLTAGARDWIDTLVALGAGFDRAPDGTLALEREAAHSRRRIVHADGDATGSAVSAALGREVRRRANVTLEDGAVALDLVRHGSRVVGVVAETPGGARIAYLARAVLLATGGIGQVFQDTTNPLAATGDGLAMAARAGAALADLEFVQFHPTALAVDSNPRPLLTEALRGAGARLIDGAGRRFLEAIDPRAELAPRDVVARAIAERNAAGESVRLDATEVAGGGFRERFPTVFEICRRHGLDPRLTPVEVLPAAHFHMGGVATDDCGRTSLPGLWAVGEVACTGVHGANRLASNSLLECLVFGRRAAADVGTALPAAPPPLFEVADPVTNRSRSRDAELETRIRRAMTRHVGVLRCAAGLDEARRSLARLEHDSTNAHPTTRNLWTVAALVTVAAANRRESRGSHCRLDRLTGSTEAPYRLALRMGANGPLRAAVERITVSMNHLVRAGR